MNVKIVDYGAIDDYHFIEYNVSGLSLEQLHYLNDNLEEDSKIEEDILKIKMIFTQNYPLGSSLAKIRLDDFIAREEIEMNVFLSSFLDDM